MIWCVSNVSENCNRSTTYDSYQSILSRTINTKVLTKISFSTGTIVSDKSSHIHCLNLINHYPLIGYNWIINQKYDHPPIVQNIPFRTIMFPFKTKCSIYWYAPSCQMAYQLHITLLILTKKSPWKPLLKISSFWFYGSVFWISNSVPTCCLNQW